LPKRYPGYSTCWRRLKEWEIAGIFVKMWRTFLSIMNAEDRIIWSEAFADGTFAAAKKGGRKVGKTRKGKGTKIMMLTDGEGTPLAVHLDSASRAEVNLIEQTLEKISVKKAAAPGAPRRKPDRLVADKAYDSNGFRARVAKRGIKPIIPARKTSLSATHQDGRSLRRYARRWKVERTFAWLLNYRRITVRWERLDYIYGGFVHLACAFIVLGRL
jgi:transposase